MIQTRFQGIGTALPSNSISQFESSDHAKEFFPGGPKRERSIEMLYKRTEIDRRSLVVIDKQTLKIDDAIFPAPRDTDDNGPTTESRMLRYEQEITPLALSACQAAFENTGINKDEITHLVTVSCTGFAAPGFDVSLINQLPLNQDTTRSHIGYMGCHGALNALRVADAFCRADQNNTVLLCAAEICSIHLQYEWCAQKIVANSLFADGAAALILRGSREEAQLPAYVSSKSSIIENSTNAMTWKISDHGFVMTLANEVPALIEQHLPKFINGWLGANGLKVADIKSWAVHPGGPRILQAVQDSLQLKPELLKESRLVLAECGNMSSPTVLFILQKILSASPNGGFPADVTRENLPCVMLGFGPGLTIEAALLNI